MFYYYQGNKINLNVSKERVNVFANEEFSKTAVSQFVSSRFAVKYTAENIVQLEFKTTPNENEYNNTINSLMQFHVIKNNLAAEGRLWNELTEKEINTLRYIRENTKGRSSAMANGVLCFYYQDCQEIELPNFDGEPEIKSAEQEPTQTDNYLSQLYVYPNPTSGFVEVLSFIPEVTILSCEVFNISSTKLFEIKSNESTLNLDLSKLEQGTYFVKVTLSNGSVEMIKIVKL